MTVDKKTLSQLQIAMKLDEYKYEKSNQQYFQEMPVIGLFDSQIIFINGYLEILENKDGDKAKEFAEMVDSIKKENDQRRLKKLFNKKIRKNHSLPYPSIN